MQDLKRNKRRMNNNKQMPSQKQSAIVSVDVDDTVLDELDRGCNCSKPAKKDTCACNTGCTPVAPPPPPPVPPQVTCNCVIAPPPPVCEPCEAERQCQPNNCGCDCCCPMTVSYCTKNTCPVAINTQRVYDAIRTQMFTDATALDGSTLYFEYEVADVRGNVPTNG